MSTTYEVKLLGGFEVRGGSRIHFPTRKTGLLFACLAMQAGRGVARDKLKSMFWSDRSEQQASGSLRRSLSDIRRVFGDTQVNPVIVTSKTDVTLNVDRFEVDLTTFERLISSDDEQALSQAAALYGGDFLITITPPDAACEEWLRIETRRLRNAANTLVERLAELATTPFGLGASEALASRLMATDPIAEEAHRALILCHLKSGRENAAKRQYQDCAAVLRRELGAEPEARTQRLIADQHIGSISKRNDSAAAAKTGHNPGPREAPARQVSIAVLPFDFRGPDPEHTCLAEGIADEILAELCKVKDFLVISRQSSNAMKDMQPTEIKERHGVNYLISGSFWRSEDTVRVSAQLVDTTTSAQIWAQRFERDIGDFFQLQDDITQRVVQSIYPEISSNEFDRAFRKPMDSLTAWEKFHRGMRHIHRNSNEDLDAAQALFEDAIAESTQYASPHAGLACVELMRATTYLPEEFQPRTDAALAHSEQALSLDPADSYSLTIHASALSLKGRFDEARTHFEKALRYNLNFLLAHYGRAQLLFRTGNYTDAHSSIVDAILRSPRDPQLGTFLLLKACCEYGLEDYGQMLETAREARAARASDGWAHLLAAIAALNIGQLEEAQAIRNDLDARFPDVSLASAKFLMENTPQDFGRKLKADLKAIDIG